MMERFLYEKTFSKNRIGKLEQKRFAMTWNLPLKDKAVLITGSIWGIGLAIAIEAAQTGAKIR